MKMEGSSTAKKDQNKLIVYVRPYDGWSRRPRDQCRQANGIIYPTLHLEGPYGHNEPLHHLDTTLIDVRGTGFAAAVPYLLDHLEGSQKSGHKTLRFHLAWSVRQNPYSVRFLWKNGSNHATQRHYYLDPLHQA
jgi:hypothetical protein